MKVQRSSVNDNKERVEVLASNYNRELDWSVVSKHVADVSDI